MWDGNNAGPLVWVWLGTWDRDPRDGHSPRDVPYPPHNHTMNYPVLKLLSLSKQPEEGLVPRQGAQEIYR